MAINKELSFDDLSAFWKYAMQDSTAHNKASRQDSSYYLDWSGGLTWEEAKRLALRGWTDIMQEIEKYRAHILPIIAEKVLRQKQVYAIAGYSVDVGSFLANEPECFITRELEARNYPGRIYKIVSSISFSSAIEPETIIKRGAMICALVDAIEYAGHRAEVVCNAAMSGSQYEDDRKGKNKERGWFEVSVVVKKTTQPLDMSDLAYCLAHPSMFRKIMFSVAELVGWSDNFSNYGYPAEPTDKGDILVKELFAETDEKAIDWVLQQLQEHGINIEQYDNKP